MRSFATDGNNDLFLSGGRLQVVDGLDAILLVCRHAAQAILGEMVLNRSAGMPYFETVWVGNPTSAQFEAAFRQRISLIEGVEGIETLETEQVGDAMRYSATIKTIYGTGVVNGAL